MVKCNVRHSFLVLGHGGFDLLACLLQVCDDLGELGALYQDSKGRDDLCGLAGELAWQHPFLEALELEDHLAYSSGASSGSHWHLSQGPPNQEASLTSNCSRLAACSNPYPLQFATPQLWAAEPCL
mmetsp:Transcript_34640/g.74764  ORF Transcript_34640/g.74764 Transcript_34640/m.74764 type:complete len:126 (-) Transcript_34640:56-433(-)